VAEEDRSSDLRKGRKDGQVSPYHSCEVQSWKERSGPFEVESLILHQLSEDEFNDLSRSGKQGRRHLVRKKRYQQTEGGQRERGSRQRRKEGKLELTARSSVSFRRSTKAEASPSS